MSKKKTTEEVYREIRAVHGDRVIPLSPYVDALTKMNFRCSVCGYEWWAKPNNVKNGNGCKLCGFKSISEKKTNTREKAEKSLAEVHGDNIVLVGDYNGQRSRTQFKCNVCGHIWTSTLKTVRKIKNCPKCAEEVRASKRRLSKEEVDERIYRSKHGAITMIGKYKTCVEPVEFLCNVCGHKWYTTPQVVFEGHGCPMCYINSLRSSISELKEALYKVHRSRISLIGEYVNRDTKTWWKCSMCGKEWEATPSNILGGRGCPKCNLSKGETRIDDWLSDNFGSHGYEAQKTFDGLVGVGNRRLSYDFFLPSKNLCIEYQGEQHFKASTFGGKKSDPSKRLERQQEHDRRKRQYCIDNNIRLLEIPYEDLDKIEDILGKELKP